MDCSLMFRLPLQDSEQFPALDGEVFVDLSPGYVAAFVHQCAEGCMVLW